MKAKMTDDKLSPRHPNDSEPIEPQMSSRLKTLFVLHLMLLMYSISDILSKSAGFAVFPSWQFFLLYAGVIVILGLYAIGWQQILARLPLTTAYSNRAVVVVWGIIWGVLFFGEAITWQKIVGAALIIAGVVLFSRADSEDLEANAIAADSATVGIEDISEKAAAEKSGDAR